MLCCCVLNCKNSFINNPDEVLFHEFPRDRDLLHYWINFTGRPNFVPNFNSYICSAHFEDDAYFINSKKLKPEAYPTVVLNEGNKSFESEEIYISNSQRVQSNESGKDPSLFTLDSNTAFNKVIMRKTLNENNKPHPYEVPNSNKMLSMVSSHSNFPMHALSEVKNTIVLNYNHKTVGLGEECYLPLEIQVPVNLFRMQIPNIRVRNQSQLTPFALPSSNSSHQSITHKQNQVSQKGPIKVVDMKKLLRPSQEDAKTIPTKSTNNDDCKIVKHVIHYKEQMPSKQDFSNKIKVQTECTSSNVTNTATLQTSKVAVSQVLDCLKLILPVKFDLARLIPNNKVAALVIRYLKLQDDSVTKNTVIMYLRIIVDAAKVKEKYASTDIKHPYLKINDIALQLALEKVLPPKFAMSDVTNLVLNCLCIVLNQDIYMDGYNILRKLIRNLINEGQHCNETPYKKTDKSYIINEKRTKNDQEEKQHLKKFKFSVTDKHERKIEKVHLKKESPCNISVSKGEGFKSSSKISASKTKPANLSFTKMLVSSEAKRRDVKSISMESKEPVGESLIDKKNVDNSQFFKSNIGLLESLKEKKIPKDRVKLEDEECTIEQTFHKEKSNKTKPEIEDPEKIKAITSYLEKENCSANDVLSSFRSIFHLCRFLRIKSRQSNIQKLNEILNLIAQNKISSRLTDNNTSPRQRSTKQKEARVETCTKKPSIKAHSSNKLKLKPVVVLQNLIDYEKEDMLFMKQNKINSGFYNKRVPHSYQHILSTKKYSSDHVKKITSESYKTFRRIVVKRLGKKLVFRLRYSKLVPGSLVFVKDFRNPSLGWLKGSINKMVDSLKYVVQLASGEMWWCTPEQLRPLPNTETQNLNSNLSPRSPRVIKPRQLFDL